MYCGSRAEPHSGASVLGAAPGDAQDARGPLAQEAPCRATPLPLGRPPPAGGAGSEPQLLRQAIPLDAGTERERHSLQRLAVIDPLAPRVPEPPLMPGQQRFDHRPQLVVGLPRLPPRQGHPQHDIAHNSTAPQEGRSARAPGTPAAVRALSCVLGSGRGGRRPGGVFSGPTTSVRRPGRRVGVEDDVGGQLGPGPAVDVRVLAPSPQDGRRQASPGASSMSCSMRQVPARDLIRWDLGTATA